MVDKVSMRLNLLLRTKRNLGVYRAIFTMKSSGSVPSGRYIPPRRETKDNFNKNFRTFFKISITVFHDTDLPAVFSRRTGQ